MKINNTLKKSYFKKGSGCFRCEDCGKLTREIDSGIMLCKDCIDKSEEENKQ